MVSNGSTLLLIATGWIAFLAICVRWFLAPGGEAEATSPLEESASVSECRAIRVCVWQSVLFYVVACLLPALDIGTGRIWHGIFCLIILPLVILHPYWYANPIFFWGLWMYFGGRFVPAAKMGLVAALLATSFFVMAYAIDPKYQLARNVKPYIGSWFWLASLWMFAACALRAAILSRRQPVESKGQSLSARE